MCLNQFHILHIMKIFVPLETKVGELGVEQFVLQLL